MKSFTTILFLLFANLGLLAQTPYAAAAGEAGSDAIHKDSSLIKGWATSCKLKRGYLNIADPAAGFTSVGDSTSALGEALSNGVLSLGDSGYATLRFDASLFDGPGPDFAIFENGFKAQTGGYYLELAFVEVSSDGQNFFRFPAHSLTDTSSGLNSFGTLQPRQLNNLAGKYRSGYGTPFDLAELAGINGLDIQAISHLRIVDVVGAHSGPHASRDTAGRAVVDPYPTAFPGGGFDLDAVAAIHLNPVGLDENSLTNVRLYPNPVRDLLYLNGVDQNADYELVDLNGRLVGEGQIEAAQIDLSSLKSGVYFIVLRKAAAAKTLKLIKQ